MKKTLFVLISLLLLLLVGCKKDSSPSSTTPPVSIVVTRVPTGTTLPLGTVVTTSWQSTNASNCNLSINGATAQPIPLSGSRTDTIKGNLILCFTALDQNGLKVVHNETISAQLLSIVVTRIPVGTTLPFGTVVMTSWQCSANAISCSLSVNNGIEQSIPLSGTRKDTIKGNLLLSFVASDKNGQKTTYEENILSSAPTLAVSSDSLHHTFGIKALIDVLFNGLDSVTSDLPSFNGSNGTFETAPLLKAINRFHFKGYLGGNIVELDSVVIFVNDSTPTALLCQANGWNPYKRYIKFNINGPWQEYLGGVFSNDLYIFYVNGRFDIYDQPTKTLQGNGYWFFFYVGTLMKLNFSGGILDSVNVTRDTLVFTDKEICIGCSEGDYLYAKYIFPKNLIPFTPPTKSSNLSKKNIVPVLPRIKK